MELQLTKRNLRRIAELDDPAIEDILGFIYDFCQDIKADTGMSVEKLVCREEDAMYKRLPWLGRTVTKISREKAAVLTAESRRERIGEMEEKLAALDRELEEPVKLQEEFNTLRSELQSKTELVHALDEEVKSLRQRKNEMETSAETLMYERNQIQSELEAEEAKMRFRMLESRQKEITLLKDRLQRIRFLREQLLQDWNSPWGEETRALAAGGSFKDMPAEILQADLDEMGKKLSQYGEDLRELAAQMNSREFRN